ncbi:hypothetical protein [Listeria fleischmannii]|uniref:hypothetical protein n=1 Tax=Listeria fleischmannii TaxID=1069827 RepID=UPI0021AB7D38|nr:hypothetical protein [Listeria fleischmannii]
MDKLAKLKSFENIRLRVNRRLIFSNVLMTLAFSVLIYLVFSHLKGVTGTEEIILLIFLSAAVLRPVFRLLNVQPTMELSTKGISYRGDFQTWQAIYELELKTPRIAIFYYGRLELYTTIKDKKELVWDISAYDSEMALSDLAELIQACVLEFGEQDQNFEINPVLSS